MEGPTGESVSPSRTVRVHAKSAECMFAYRMLDVAHTEPRTSKQLHSQSVKSEVRGRLRAKSCAK